MSRTRSSPITFWGETDEARVFLLREYSEHERSTYDIAEERNTYANAIRKALVFHNIPLRSKKEAQAIALKSGRHGHPTKGKERTEDERERIRGGVAKAWNSKNEGINGSQS